MDKENIKREAFIHVGTTLYKLVNQPHLNGGYMKKLTVWNNETRHGIKDSNGRCGTEYYRYVRGNSMGTGTALLRKM